jgi:hypothetical protein
MARAALRDQLGRAAAGTCRRTCRDDRSPEVALFGSGGTLDLSPKWGPERTSSKRCSTADRLQEHCVPVEIKELLLATRERAHIDGLCGVDTHPLK